MTTTAEDGPTASRAATWLMASILVAGAVLVCLFYARPLAGLNLDDGYIYLEYARNLVEHGELAFNRGETASFGSTSFSWTMLVAGVHWLFRGELISEVQLIGALCLGVAAALWALTLKRLGGTTALGLLLGGVLITDPFLVENALSGMDTVFNMLVLSAIVFRICRPGFSGDWLTGLLLGIAFLTRPDNLILLPATLLAVLLSDFESEKAESAKSTGPRVKQLLRPWAGMALAFTLLVVPYLVWMHMRIGSFIPPTRIGKMQVFLPAYYGLTFEEFGAASPMLRLEIAWSCIRETVIPFLTFNCRKTVLLPIALGVLALPYLLVKDRPRRGLYAFFLVYLVGLSLFLGLYFPLVKDRYLVNFHPILIACFGLLCVHLQRTRTESGPGLLAPSRLATLVLLVSLVGNLAFVGHYRRAYLQQVGNSNVWIATGEWFRANSIAGERIALEPIGAIKFASGEYILDMGGLVTQETWPSAAGGLGTGFDTVHELFEKKQVDYVVDHDPNEWFGFLTRFYPEHYALVARIEPSPEGRHYGATDRFEIFATSWGRHVGPPSSGAASRPADTEAGAED
jgi:hypothetical protein